MQQEITILKDRIKDYLPQYLNSLGINTSKPFKCLSPDHSDTHPSCGVIKNNPRLFHCLSCNFTGEIFDAAAFLEGKPTSGPTWLTDNLFYLANKFGLEIPLVEMSPQELHELEVHRAYHHAYQFIKSSKINDLVQAKLLHYNWGRDVIAKFGIGSVNSYESYLDKMTKLYKYKHDFLKECDLANPNIFHPNNLIYPFKDENGNPVGFSARNLTYEQEKLEYEKSLETDSQGKLFKPKKYYNTSSNCPIFHKSKLLFNFDQAKNIATNVYIFEGQADTLTAFSGGIKNAVGICSTAFSKDHLDLLRSYNINHFIFVLDSDDAGMRATKKFMDLSIQCQGQIGLRLEAIVLPKGHDPDSFIRSYGDIKIGTKAFRNLPKIDSFTWQLEQSVEEGQDAETIANKILPSIVNEPNNIIRQRMADQLADTLKLDKFFVHRELKRLLDENIMQIEEEKLTIAVDLAGQLRKDPQSIETILSSAIAKVERIDKKNNKFSIDSILKSVNYVYESQEKNINKFELVSGYPILDELLGGFPTEGCYGTCPGKSHHGKSIFVDNFIIGLLDHNPELIVLLHSVDDDKIQRLPRLMGTKFNLPSDMFRKAGYYISGEGAEKYPNFKEQYQKANKWLNDMIISERFFIGDSGDLPGDLSALKNWIKNIRERHPNRPILVVGDNFHLYDLSTSETGEAKTRYMSRYITTMISELKISTLFTMEIPKDALRTGIRPSYLNLKNSGGITFDSKLNLGVYQERQDYGGTEGLTWVNTEVLSDIVLNNGEIIYGPTEMPILELIIDKNKINGKTRTIYYKLNIETGRMEECSEIEQQAYKKQSEINNSNRNKKGFSQYGQENRLRR